MFLCHETAYVFRHPEWKPVPFRQEATKFCEPVFVGAGLILAARTLCPDLFDLQFDVSQLLINIQAVPGSFQASQLPLCRLLLLP